MKKNYSTVDDFYDADDKKTERGIIKKQAAKFTALVIAGATFIGVISAFATSCSKKEEKEPTTSVSDTTKEDEEKQVSYKYVLYNPIDMNNQDEVNKLIAKINENVEEDRPKLTLETFNLLTKDITKEQFPGKTDEEIAEAVNVLAISLYDVLSSNIVSFIDAKTYTLLDKKEGYSIPEKLVISGFNLIDKNSYIHQTYQGKIDEQLEKELNDIINSNITEYASNALSFYDVVMEVLKDQKLNSFQRDKMIVLQYLKSIYPLYSSILLQEAPDKRTTLDAEFSNLAINAWESDVLSNMGLITDAYLGKKTKDRTGTSYSLEDKKLEDAYKGATKRGETKVTSNNTKNYSVVEKPATTGKTVEKETVYKVPEDESKKAETTTVKDNSNVTVGKPSVSVKPPEKLEEEDVPPEVEPDTSWSYKDDDGEEWVVVPDENGVPVLTPEEINKINGTAKTLK